MSFLSALWRVELRVLLAVLVCAILMAGYMAIDVALGSTNYSGAGRWAGLGFFGTIIYGLPVAALFGAPLYVFLMLRSALSWPRVLLIGALPSAPIAMLELNLALLFLIGGILVAAITHALTPVRPLTTRWSGP